MQQRPGRYSCAIKFSLLVVIIICCLCLASNLVSIQGGETHSSFSLDTSPDISNTKTVAHTVSAQPPSPVYTYPEVENILVVLGNEPLDDATPTIDTMTRVRKAVEYFSMHPSSILIFTGGPTAGKVTEAQVMANYAMSLGVPKTVIR